MEMVNDENRFGDYVLKECIWEGTDTRTWLAEQTSVGRMVVVEELKEGAGRSRADFLSDVRAKAAVEHPIVASIYEASTEDGRIYFAHELLPGETLEARMAGGEKDGGGRLAHILKKVAEANLHHENHGNATSTLGAGEVRVDSQGVVRVENLVISGERPADQSVRDVMRLGAALVPLLDEGSAAANRCLTLLAWMRGEGLETPLGWEDVRGYCTQIEQQLGEAAPVAGGLETDQILTGKKGTFVGVIGGLLLLIGIGIALIPSKKEGKSPEAPLPGWVTIEAGKRETPEGLKLRTEAFEISAHEVTIGEYEKFLDTLELLSGDGDEKVYDHPEEPEEKTGHVPDDWPNLLARAKEGGEWNGKEIGSFTPVVGVDWWDAYAYARWKKGRLPTQEQWLAALMAGSADPARLKVSEWLPANGRTPDRTENGLRAMAGSVSEWSAEARANPANPLGATLWVIMGGSYASPGRGAQTREWVRERSLRRADLGFRICRDLE